MTWVLLDDGFLTSQTNQKFFVEAIVQGCQLAKNLSIQSRVPAKY